MVIAIKGDLTSEYFIVEYLTPTSNNAQMQEYSWFPLNGARIFHVCADLFTDQWYRTNFTYDSFGENFLGYDRFRVLRLVNESENSDFYHTGDVCKFGTKNFAGYDANGYQTIDTGYTVTIGAMGNGSCEVIVDRK